MIYYVDLFLVCFIRKLAKLIDEQNKQIFEHTQAKNIQLPYLKKVLMLGIFEEDRIKFDLLITAQESLSHIFVKMGFSNAKEINI